MHKVDIFCCAFLLCFLPSKSTTQTDVFIQTQPGTTKEQAWETASWCGVTPFKAKVYWQKVVQQTFEVHDLSYSGGGGGVYREGWTPGKSDLHHWNFQISEYLRLNVTDVVVPVVHNHRIYWHWHTMFLTGFTDIHWDRWCIKQQLYFGYHGKAAFPSLAHNKPDTTEKKKEKKRPRSKTQSTNMLQRQKGKAPPGTGFSPSGIFVNSFTSWPIGNKFFICRFPPLTPIYSFFSIPGPLTAEAKVMNLSFVVSSNPEVWKIPLTQNVT